MRAWKLPLLFLVAVAIAPDLDAQQYISQFSGEVVRTQRYEKEIGSGLLFVLQPSDTGWTIAMVPKAPCALHDEWAYLVNPPYRSNNALLVDTGYGITAKEAANWGPREFFFVRTCDDAEREGRKLEIVLWPYNYSKKVSDEALATLGCSPLGKATFTVTAAKVSRAAEEVEGKNYGKIDSLKFLVRISSQAVHRCDHP